MTEATTTTPATTGFTSTQDALDAYTKAQKAIANAVKRIAIPEAFLVQTIGEGNSAVLNFNGNLVNVTITNGTVNFSFVNITENIGVTTPSYTA